MSRKEYEVVVVGGGLVGSILAIFLRKRGYEVHVFEKRPDIRGEQVDGGRSINLVVTSRGIQALEQVGLKDEILKITIPVYGRMMHSVEGDLTYQSYSKDNSECNYSVSRAQLNQEMITHAEKAGVHFHFEHELQDIDFEKGLLTFLQGEVLAKRIFGTDGAGSAVRIAMAKQEKTEENIDFLDHGYKELLIPAGPDASYIIEKNALHIWPRGEHMLMALPNLDGSFTVTLYLANKGSLSFDALQSEEQILDYFKTHYADSIPLMPELVKEFAENPVGLLGTVRCLPWHYKDKVVLLGDAAHGIVPFFGQGMNAGFEGCSVLNQLLDTFQEDFGKAFEAFTEQHKKNGDAIADMALENFVEMRERVGDKHFLLQKKVEALIGRTFPESYLSRYSMVTHSLIPYHLAQKTGLLQQEMLNELCKDINTPEELDLEVAKKWIDEKLTPFFQKHGITW